jgi:predicted NAD-dependent protein-ADP-ribosyltransferase YbiA (DUF1768 family)
VGSGRWLRALTTIVGRLFTDVPARAGRVRAECRSHSQETHVGSQEEALFRTSSLPLSLWPLRRRDDRRFGAFDGRIPRAPRPAYPWTSDATVIYSPTVVVTRDSQGRALPGKLRTTLSVVSVAAQDLRTGHQHVPDDACFDRALTQEKCRSVLWAATHHGHDAVVLGALGCGAFRNDPDEVCDVFREVLEPGGEFGASFSAVIFAVIKSGRNLRAFAQGGFPLLKVMSRRLDEVGAQISSLLLLQAGGGAAAAGGGAGGAAGGGAGGGRGGGSGGGSAKRGQARLGGEQVQQVPPSFEEPELEPEPEPGPELELELHLDDPLMRTARLSPVRSSIELPAQLSEPLVYLSAAQVPVCARYPGTALARLPLPSWVPQRVVAQALGHSDVGIRGAVASLGGRAYVWATQFENVHSLWKYGEPSIEVGGRRYRCSEEYYHTQKPRPFDDAVWDQQKLLVMERAVRAKLRADPFLEQLLLATRNHPLLSLKSDAVWGFDPARCQGQNLLAKIWMKVRAELAARAPPRGY